MGGKYVRLNVYVTALAFVGVYGVLLLVGVLKLLGPDLDYELYVNWFGYANHEQASTKEVAFTVVRSLVKAAGGGIVYFYLVYVGLALAFKLGAMYRQSYLPLMSLLVYLSVYFPLHEYTQVRAGVASAIMLLSMPLIASKRYFYWGLFFFCALMFHWSSVVFLLSFLIIVFVPLRVIYWLPPVGVALVFVSSGVKLLVDWIFSLNPFLDVYYATHAGHMEAFNTFNVLFLMNVVWWLLIWFFTPPKVLFGNRNFSVLYSVFSISIFQYLLTSSLNLPVISIRLYELLNIVLVVLIPNFCFSARIKPRWVLWFYVVVYCAVNIYYLVGVAKVFPEMVGV